MFGCESMLGNGKACLVYERAEWPRVWCVCSCLWEYSRDLQFLLAYEYAQLLKLQYTLAFWQLPMVYIKPDMSLQN